MVLQKETKCDIFVIASACMCVCIRGGGVCVYVWICASLFMYILVHVCMGWCLSVFKGTLISNSLHCQWAHFFTRNDYVNNFTEFIISVYYLASKVCEEGCMLFFSAE